MTNGWELTRSSYHPAFLADVQYADPKAARPASADLMVYYNQIPRRSA